MKFGLPENLNIKVPKDHEVFTVYGMAFAYPSSEKATLGPVMLVAMVDVAGNPSWKRVDEGVLINAVINHLYEERRSNSDGHM